MIDNEMITEAQPERWLPIPGYEGLYEVSSLGRVRSCERLIIGSDGRRRVFPSRIRKLMTYNEYVYVSLLVNQKEKRHLVHRLVAEAFIPNPDKKECVDHLNTKRDDNRACNLAWVSHAENQKNPITAQRLKWRVTPVKRISPAGEVKIYEMLTDVRRDGFNASSVCMCCKGYRNKTHYKGYKWEYANE